MNLVALIVILLAIAFLLRIDFIFYLVYVCVGLLLASRLIVPSVMRRLQASRTFADHAFSGETVDIVLRVKNQSRIPLPWLEVSESVAPELRVGDEDQWAISLGGRQQRQLTYQVRTGRRGYYKVGPTRLTSGDLYGLVAPIHGQLDADHLTVYPRIIPLAELGLPSRLPFGTIASGQRIFEDPARPAGVRDYRSGDSQRQINWKASAHANHLLVRRYQPAISLESAVLLNLHSADYARREWRYHVEWAIVVAASLAAHLANQRQAVGLITNGLDPLLERDNGLLQFDPESGRLLLDDQLEGGRAIPLPPALLPRSGRAQLMKVLEIMARIESAATAPLHQWAPTACAPLSWGVTILAVTPRGDEQTCQALHYLVRSGFNPLLLVIEPDAQEARTRERARQLGFRAFHVTPATNLDQWRRSRREAAAP